MMRALYIAKTGLETQQTNMDIISNNIANVNTDGFKRSRGVFEELMYQTIRQPGAKVGEDSQLPSGLQLGTGARTVATERLHTQGAMKNTGNSMDIAIQGKGFLQIELPDGSQAYTREGSLQLNQNGQLVTSSGYPLQPPINIPANALSVAIGRYGKVSVTQPGQTGVSVPIGQIQVATFANPTGLQSQGQNLYVETDSSGPPTVTQPGLDDAGEIMQQYTESSNVNVAEELVMMITTQRAYEMNSKVVQAADQMLSKLTSV